MYDFYTEATISVYSAQEKGLLGLSSLIFERGAPKNEVFYDNLEVQIFKDGETYSAGEKCV